jgi:hypothetical protein
MTSPHGRVLKLLASTNLTAKVSWNISHMLGGMGREKEASCRGSHSSHRRANWRLLRPRRSQRGRRLRGVSYRTKETHPDKSGFNEIRSSTEPSRLPANVTLPQHDKLRCHSWVNCVVSTVVRPLPVCPYERTWQTAPACLKRAMNGHGRLFDHVVGAGEE